MDSNTSVFEQIFKLLASWINRAPVKPFLEAEFVSVDISEGGISYSHCGEFTTESQFET